MKGKTVRISVCRERIYYLSDPLRTAIQVRRPLIKKDRLKRFLYYQMLLARLSMTCIKFNLNWSLMQEKNDFLVRCELAKCSTYFINNVFSEKLALYCKLFLPMFGFYFIYSYESSSKRFFSNKFMCTYLFFFFFRNDRELYASYERQCEDSLVNTSFVRLPIRYRK